MGLARAAFTVFVAWRKLICGRLSLSLTSFFTADQWVAPPWRMQLKNTQIYRLKANSYHHARHDETVLSVWRPLRRRELDFRQRKTVADPQKIWSLNTSRAIVQFTPAHRTRLRQDRLVVSGVAVWIGHNVFLTDSVRVSRWHYCMPRIERTCICAFGLLSDLRNGHGSTDVKTMQICCPGWVTLIIGPY